MSRPAVERGAVVWVDGPDASTFLNGLLSADVAGLAVGRTVPALFLDATGHIRVMLRAHRTAADGFTLVTDAGQGEPLRELLDRYHFSEELEVIGPEPVDVVTYPADAAVAGADMVLPGSVPGTLDAVGSAAAIAPSTPLTAEALEARRVAAGTPRFGIDVGPRALVHEAGLQGTAVSFDKGCYLGQETVARVEHRGGVRRRLAGVWLPAAAPAGAQVTVSGRPVGALTSVAVHPELGPIGIGIIRLEAAPGDRVEVAGLDAPGIVADLPFPDARPDV